MEEADLVDLKPQVSARGGTVLADLATELATLDILDEDATRQLHRLRDDYLEKALEAGGAAQAVRVCVSVYCDLRGQGWRFTVSDDEVRVALPKELDDPQREKARIRAGLLVERDRQLREPSVRTFVAEMERRRIGPQGDWVSIFSLMRDGEALVSELRAALALEAEAARAGALRRAIQPYLQLVDDSECEHTGIPLKEIWRYFRYTWSSPHKSLPGRTIWYLVRDAAAPYHPVIGIAALGSAVVQLRIRDEWIGWTKKAFLKRLRSNPSDEWAHWLEDRLCDQFDALFTGDLARRLGVGSFSSPTSDHIEQLRKVSKKAREEHRLYGSSRDHKGGGASVNWEVRARTPLFTSKRASTLADLLEDRLALRNAGFTAPTAANLERALAEEEGRRAIGRILRRVKGAHVGIDMLDITVCGAVAPYNHILGGKLVSLLLTSPEVRESYERRYAHRSSVIASSMAGRPVRRTPQLVLLGTTSLYGVGSSQYNRLRLPTEEVGGPPDEEIRYEERGVTEGYGSLHFSAPTLGEIRTYYAQEGNGRTVKHIFGEGANPRMREVREALDRVGLPSDRLMKHENSRVVYTIPLAANFRDVLVEKAATADYLIPGDSPGDKTGAIVDFWVERWLSGRVQKDRILEAVSGHTLAYPVDHGARVNLPNTYKDTPLFAYAPES